MFFLFMFITLFVFFLKAAVGFVVVFSWPRPRRPWPRPPPGGSVELGGTFFGSLSLILVFIEGRRRSSCGGFCFSFF